jgi:hypothetical protein
MSVSLAYETTVSIVSCAACGAPIALANESQLRESHASFHCPNGHSNVFNGATAAEKKAKALEAELAREKQRREMAEREAKMERKRAEKAERKVKRTNKGVCSCCNRSFTNLRRHMETQHPDEVKTP